MNFYDLEREDVACITEDMEKIFKEVLREVIKNCMSVGDYGEGEFRDLLIFKTCYDSGKTIGCIDGDYIILLGDFIYERLCMRWEKWMNMHKDAPYLPYKSEFYKSLYCNNVLPHGIFFQEPLYQLSIESEEDGGWYFFIRPEYFGFKLSMIEWH